MGLLDMVYVCPKCRKVQITSTANCSSCGTGMVVANASPKKWRAMSDEEQAEVVSAALAKAQQNGDGGVGGFEETEYPITTTERFENAEIEEYLGTVSGTDIYLVGGVLGGGMANQENLFGTAFAAAKSKMLSKAKERGGNAVVGMSVNVCSPGNLNNIIVIVTGTAVKVEKK